MESEKDIKLLMALFQQDIEKNKGPSDITDLMVLTIKSLIPSENHVEVNVDYERYGEELKLWKYYRHGENQSLMNIIDGVGPQIYWEAKDDTIYSRILPIVLTNKDYLVVKKEVIKNILYTTGNLEVLIEGLLISKLIHLLILGEKEIVEKLKDEIIHFTQVEFKDEFEDEYKIPIDEYEGNFSVEFERNKIYALSMLNSSGFSKFNVLKDSMNVILNNKVGETNIGKAIETYIKDRPIGEYELQDYYNELSSYVHRLRKGRIEPDSLKIQKYYLPDIFELDEGKIFYHSLLNKSKVIKKETIGNKKVSYVSSKSGIYKFIK